MHWMAQAYIISVIHIKLMQWNNIFYVGENLNRLTLSRLKNGNFKRQSNPM